MALIFADGFDHYTELITTGLDLTTHEGCVVRLAGSFPYSAFRRSVAKFVRPGHIQSSHNWKMKAIVKNELRKDFPSA